MIYITGDTHGDLKDLLSRNVNKIKRNDVLIITGDFGFIWDNSKTELKSIKKLSKLKYKILFVEGVHENFDMLDQYEYAEIFNGQARKISDNIYCLKRGEIYTIEDKKVFCLGGGDVDDYIEKVDTDPLKNKSLPTDEELKYAVDNLKSVSKKIDIIITHEAPASVKKLIRRDCEINDLNIFLDTLLHNAKYDKWYFGSLHTDRAVTNQLICVWQEVLKAN